MQTSSATISNERSDEPLPTELLKATKKVRNKDTIIEDGEDQTMLEPEVNKPSFKEMLLGNGNASAKEDSFTPLNEEKELALTDDDVSISLEGTYAQVCFSERIHSLIDESNKQTVVVRMLGRPIDYKALSNRIESLWGLTGAYKIVDLDNNYFLVKLASQDDYNKVIMGGPWMVYGHYLVVQPWSRDFSMEETYPSKIIA